MKRRTIVIATAVALPIALAGTATADFLRAQGPHRVATGTSVEGVPWSLYEGMSGGTRCLMLVAASDKHRFTEREGLDAAMGSSPGLESAAVCTFSGTNLSAVGAANAVLLYAGSTEIKAGVTPANVRSVTDGKHRLTTEPLDGVVFSKDARYWVTDQPFTTESPLTYADENGKAVTFDEHL